MQLVLVLICAVFFAIGAVKADSATTVPDVTCPTSHIENGICNIAWNGFYTTTPGMKQVAGYINSSTIYPISYDTSRGNITYNETMAGGTFRIEDFQPAATVTVECMLGTTAHPEIHTTCNIQCGSPASVVSDPVFTGFNNQTFEFLGQAGSNYTVLSDDSMAVNMQLVEAGPLHIRAHEGHGTFVGALAVLLPSFQLAAQVDKAGNMTFRVNGRSFDIETSASFKGGQVTYDPYVPGLGQVITIQKRPFNLSIIAIKEYNDSRSGYNRGHFDLQAAVTGPPTSLTLGVLGETLGRRQTETVPVDEAMFEIPYLTHSRLAPVSMGQPASRVRLAAVSRHLLAVRSTKYPRYASIASAVEILDDD